MLEARRPDIVFVDKQAMEAKITDIAIPGYARVKDKGVEKIEKLQVPTSQGRNKKVVEAEESDCSASRGRSIKGCI